MICPVCGTQNSDDARICVKCGAILKGDGASAQNQNQNQDNNVPAQGNDTHAQEQGSDTSSGRPFTPAAAVASVASVATAAPHAIKASQNPIGLIGFILALISLISGFLPTAGWPVWIHAITWALWGAGLILSFIGVFKHPKGFAIAGLVISLFDVILFCVIIMVSALSGLFFPDWGF